jgi:H+/Cl- antiporter ClcA
LLGKETTMSEFKSIKIEYNDTDNWSHINEFLKRERDAYFATLTHIRLAVVAGIIVVILLSISSLISPLASYLEFSDNHSFTYSSSTYSIVFLLSFAVTVLLILLFLIWALYRLYKALRHSLIEELRNRVEAVKTASEKSNVEIPLQTQELLETFDYENFDKRSQR